MERKRAEKLRQDLRYAEERAREAGDVDRRVREAEAYLIERGFHVLGFIRDTP